MRLRAGLRSPRYPHSLGDIRVMLVVELFLFVMILEEPQCRRLACSIS